ncbi:hypothetical protein D3C76_1068170 [compost metagenome]
MGRALPDHFPRADLASGLAIDLRQLLLVLGAAAEAVHALDGFHRCRRQAGEAFQHLQVLAVEACRVHGIQRQQSPGAIVQVERATQAVVHFQVFLVAFHQAIVWVGQPAVRGEMGDATAFHQCLQPRMLGDLEAPSQGVLAQAVHRQGHQLITVQAQQGGGIAGQEPAQRFEQAPVAFALGKFAGEIADQRDQCLQQGVRCHYDSMVSI